VSELKVTGEVRHIHENVAPISIELTRGQRGAYGWSIKVYGEKMDDIIAEIEKADNKLREEYLEGGAR